ncbi:MAG: hypothetical protein NZ772_03385, partial [Cyanobacteria bacterium]|nr:hypothetical protein [Cyanobacteriota bacterium]MDW8200513.1 hypothetical protein [Cyanobacteriota bacterium SKYGB_h_bin112]
LEGILAAATGCRYESILDETSAINTALDQAPSGSLVVILPESVDRAISLVKARQPIEPSVSNIANGSPLATSPTLDVAQNGTQGTQPQVILEPLESLT